MRIVQWSPVSFEVIPSALFYSKCVMAIEICLQPLRHSRGSNELTRYPQWSFVPLEVVSSTLFCSEDPKTTEMQLLVLDIVGSSAAALYSS
jgi:hypothetical protein